MENEYNKLYEKKMNEIVPRLDSLYDTIEMFEYEKEKVSHIHSINCARSASEIISKFLNYKGTLAGSSFEDKLKTFNAASSSMLSSFDSILSYMTRAKNMKDYEHADFIFKSIFEIYQVVNENAVVLGSCVFRADLYGLGRIKFREIQTIVRYFEHYKK